MTKPKNNNCSTCEHEMTPEYSLVVYVSVHCANCGEIKSQFIESLTKLGISSKLKGELEEVLFANLDDYSPWPKLRPKKKKQPKRVPKRKPR